MNALEELTEDRIDRVYVERRVEDWKRRIADLYADIVAWLPSGWVASDGGTLAMHEELMQRFAMSPQAIPVLRLDQDGVYRGKLEPRNLWIIGNNGRVDLILSNRHYLIVDRSESFEPANWRIADLTDRIHEAPFTRLSLIKALE